MKKDYTKPEFEKLSISATESILSATADLDNAWGGEEGNESMGENPEI